MYFDLNCFSYALTFLSISFFITKSLIIFVIITHFPETFSFPCFVRWQTYLKNVISTLSCYFFIRCTFSYLSIIVSRFSNSFGFSVSFGSDIFIHVEKKSFIIIYVSCDLRLRSTCPIIANFIIPITSWLS